MKKRDDGPLISWADVVLRDSIKSSSLILRHSLTQLLRSDISSEVLVTLVLSSLLIS